MKPDEGRNPFETDGAVNEVAVETLMGWDGERWPSVVIVDDIPETVSFIGKLLDLEGVPVLATAGTAAEGLEAARRVRPDVVLMDLMMPGLGAFEAIEAIRLELPTTRVVIMSIQNGADYIAHGLRAGASEYLVKPFSADELFAALRAATNAQPDDSGH